MNKLDIFQDTEFQNLPQEKKNQVLTNYFNTNLADDSFKSLDNEKQSTILNNFINSQLTPVESETSIPEQKKEKTFLDKAKDFGKNYIDA